MNVISGSMEREHIISESIIDEYFQKLKNSLDVDAIVVGGGPSGLYAAYRLAMDGFKINLLEKRCSLGGGIWGGGMMFNIELAGALIYKVSKSGANILNCMYAEDIVLKDNKVRGVVVNWSPVGTQELMVDPLIMLSKIVIDATGHGAEIVSYLSRRKKKIVIRGEGAMDIEHGDVSTVNDTKEIYPGLIVCGMTGIAVSVSPRMGPTFGGMLLSGKKAYQLAKERIKQI